MEVTAHAWLRRANIKVSSTETGAIFGNIVYESTGYAERSVVVLNDIHIDIMDYISAGLLRGCAIPLHVGRVRVGEQGARPHLPCMPTTFLPALQGTIPDLLWCQPSFPRRLCARCSVQHLLNDCMLTAAWGHRGY